MNMDTVLKCAQMAARQQEAFLGAVDADIQALLAELTPVEEPPEVAQAEAEAEAMEAAEEVAPAPEAEAAPDVPSEQ